MYTWDGNPKENMSIINDRIGHNDKNNDEDKNKDDVLIDIADILKPYVQYNISGWHIKRTKKSKWIPVIEECLLVFMQKKLDAHNKIYSIDISISNIEIEALRLKLLVL